MSRLPDHVVAEVRVRIPTGFEGCWKIIRELRTFRPADVLKRVSIDLSQIADYCRRLEKAGFVGRDETGVYALLIDQPDAPRLRRDGTPAVETGGGQDRMWRVMKMAADFDARDLAAAATTEDGSVSVGTAKAYIKKLHGAGYLMISEPWRTSGSRKAAARRQRYRLKPSMNTGPLAPRIQTTDYVYDPNTGKVYGADDEASS